MPSKVKPKVLILGSSGMLGSMLLDYLARHSNFDIKATTRSTALINRLKKNYNHVEFLKLDAHKATSTSLIKQIKDADWVLNAIGVIKPYIKEDNSADVHNAVLINSHFPHVLAGAAQKTGAKVIQIATDCVFSGTKGNYSEAEAHDPTDVYGKTKSLGEVLNDNFFNLRCSIVGPETHGHKSLLEWFLGQDEGAKINGFINHKWNGLTTLHFAKICEGIIHKNLKLSTVHHVVPANSVVKAGLLKNFAKEFKRPDIIINDVRAERDVNNTLATQNQAANRRLWQAAGYEKPPTIQQMVKELAKYKLVIESS